MDRSFKIPADSSEFADLPWEAYFDAVLPRSGISETIPCSSISPSQSLHSSESIPLAYTPLMAQDDEIIDSADNFNILSSINYHSDSPKFDILDSADAFDALSSSTTEITRVTSLQLQIPITLQQLITLSLTHQFISLWWLCSLPKRLGSPRLRINIQLVRFDPTFQQIAACFYGRLLIRSWYSPNSIKTYHTRYRK